MYRCPVDPPFQGALTALLIGLLLGLERQRSQREEQLFAGIRTFPVLTLAGYLAALSGASWAVAATVLAIAALAVTSYLRTAGSQAGATTEALAILSPILGAAILTHPIVAAASGVVVTLLLTLKAPLHRIAGSVSEMEILSILKFGVVAVVLLPLLPTTPVDPWQAVVPRTVGWVVVILCAVSLLGYLLVRLLGSRSGWALAGLLGGLVSSTAVTLSFASRARKSRALSRPLAVGILLASTILYARGLFLIGLFDSALALFLLPRLGALFAVSLVFAALYFRGASSDDAADIEMQNPVELGRAFLLAALFAGILLMARVAEAELGTQGLWATGALGGLLDVDSVAVAVARMRAQEIVPVEAAGGAWLLATASNLLLKGGVVLAVGGLALFRRIGPAFGALAVLTVALIAMF
jgi:uncharacterized membrane protein (DUF4010 family)